MNFKELFDSQMLNEETKAVISEAFEQAVEAKRVELEESYVAKLDEAKTEITGEAFQLIESALDETLEELAEEIAEARTLDVRYAKQLNEFKEKYAEKMEESVQVMVAEKVAEEMDELKEDIEVAKKHQFVSEMFEAFRQAYEANFVGEVDEESLRNQLKEATDELSQIKRDRKIAELLEGVSGSKREVAMTLLESTPTERLETRFEALKPILMAESKETEGTVVTEGAEDGKEQPSGTVVIEEGDVVEEGAKSTGSDAYAQRIEKALRRAGVLK